jgi:hypothetical protein
MKPAEFDNLQIFYTYEGIIKVTGIPEYIFEDMIDNGYGFPTYLIAGDEVFYKLSEVIDYMNENRLDPEDNCI